MATFLSLLVVGLATGAVYALVALGYTLVYGIIELINFAHGDVFTIGTFVTIVVLNVLGVQAGNPPKAFTWSLVGALVLACLASFVVCAVLGVLIERIAYRPLRNAPRLAPLISAIGVSLILQDVAKLWLGSAQVSFVSLPTPNITIGIVSFNSVNIVLVVAALLLCAGLYYLINRTSIGRAMRAVAQDRDAAALMGVNVNRIIAVTFLIGSGLAGAAGFIYGLEFPNTQFNAGFQIGLIAFTAAVLGGIGNIVGAMLGGLIIGMVVAMVSYIPPSILPQGGVSWQEAVVYVVLILILVFRPAGLLGQSAPEKV
jgi:branched-chain amino acid transport system permease protein